MESEHFHCEAIASRVLAANKVTKCEKDILAVADVFSQGAKVQDSLNDMFSYFNIMFAHFFQFCASFCDFLQVFAASCDFLRFQADASSRCEREKIKLPEVLKRSLSENDEENEVSNKATKFCLEFCNPLLRFCCSQVDEDHSRRGGEGCCIAQR